MRFNILYWTALCPDLGHTKRSFKDFFSHECVLLCQFNRYWGIVTVPGMVSSKAGQGPRWTKWIATERATSPCPPWENLRWLDFTVHLTYVFLSFDKASENHGENRTLWRVRSAAKRECEP